MALSDARYANGAGASCRIAPRSSRAASSTAPSRRPRIVTHRDLLVESNKPKPPASSRPVLGAPPTRPPPEPRPSLGAPPVRPTSAPLPPPEPPAPQASQPPAQTPTQSIRPPPRRRVRPPRRRVRQRRRSAFRRDLARPAHRVFRAPKETTERFASAPRSAPASRAMRCARWLAPRGRTSSTTRPTPQ